ncbi:methyl-accepting chemotaxis protein [Clostridium estertheticum]|uniref:methyl-accepting chemotaxis protein n=1 Tax=Clostridium estertheticum TaxID=238834 RepID=UPI001C0E29D4|nr:methyl-accepting chemotaxis protein [Clostridium estertheticum]MBU3199133.1 methyl-accepting chemotaxis protein [Clostridium estertheticum]WAG63606.1 methyl-accepting chemotaxis protein [Clostridium estertheticum]
MTKFAMKKNINFTKVKSIKTLILISILPVVLIALAIIGVFSIYTSKKLITTEIQNRMEHQLQENINLIDKDMQKHSQIAVDIAKVIGTSRLELNKSTIIETQKEVLSTNKDTLGVGVWFEPYKYKKDIKYFGPYAYKETGTSKVTEDYATQQYNYPTQPWYIIGKNIEKNIAWKEPYYDDNLKMTMLTTTAPIYDNKNFLGVVTADMSLNTIQENIKNIKVGQTGKAMLLGKNGTYLAGVDREVTMKGKITEDKNTSIAKLGKDILQNKEGISYYEDDNGKNFVYYKQIPELGWSLVLSIPQKELYSPINKLLFNIIILILITCVLVVFAVNGFSRYLTKNIKEVNDLSHAIAEGDLTQILNVRTGNELGSMGNNLNRMTNNLREIVKKVTESLEQVVATSEELTASSDQTQQSAQQVSLAIQHVALGSVEQVTITNDTTKIAEEIFTGMEQISNNIQAVTNISLESFKRAEKGNDIVYSAIKQMNNISDKVAMSSKAVSILGDKSKEIGSIVSLITSIAGQTNLLALNAAIEAARAGEQGKGFAVVADEVRKLAEQSASAAGNISNLINEIQKEIVNAVKAMDNGTIAVKDGISMVNQAGKSFGAILEDINYIASQMQDVSAVTEEIGAGSQNMLGAIENVAKISTESSENAENVVAASEEQTALMKEVANAAENLTQMAVELQSLMSNFRL